ncbi:hypothetical protein PUN28_002610 [Cardiocondyla obscurior]|uniref:Cytochrome c oxidase assembly factor 3 n=1 Tax=Cardiocondyla obscurior TaxID=286306 RepID=A0AAW2GV30_9HYME
MDPGFQTRKRKERLYNKMHKGAVGVCMGVTAIGGLLLCLKVYEYFRYIQPLHNAQNKLSQDELLLEGRSREDSPNVDLST